MNDQELLELAALAVGFIDDQTCEESFLEVDGLHRNGQGIYYVLNRTGFHNWNPLAKTTAGRSDCLQMETDLKLSVEYIRQSKHWKVSAVMNNNAGNTIFHKNIYNEDRQRASVMAAAELGKQIIGG